MTDQQDRIYYACSEVAGSFIAIKHGDTGYYETTVYTQEHADELNKRQGITDNEVKAAKACSMFDCWRNFDKLASRS